MSSLNRGVLCLSLYLAMCIHAYVDPERRQGERAEVGSDQRVAKIDTRHQQHMSAMSSVTMWCVKQHRTCVDRFAQLMLDEQGARCVSNPCGS